MHILRYVTGLAGWGMLTFMLTCVTCTSYVTSLGRRWMNSKTKSLMEVTGRALKDRVAMWVGKKDPASFQEQIPCNLQVIVWKSLQNPREFWANFGAWISSFAMAKTTFFKNNIKTLARFSRRRDIYIYIHVAIQVTLLRIHIHTNHVQCRMWLFVSRYQLGLLVFCCMITMGRY